MYEPVRAPPPPEAAPAPRRVRAADLYPRLRTHYDEPELDAPFQPICGEFVQWVGRTSDGGVLAISNYRLHAQARRRRGAGVSVPLRLVDAAEVRDLNQLIVHCKDGKTLKCTFSTGEACAEWSRRVSAGTAPAAALQETFAAAYAAWARELPPASAPRTLLDTRHGYLDTNQWFKKEVERLGFTERGAWRVTAANSEYKLCPSYPPLLIVPACIGDEDLDSVARFRAMRRLPAVVWRHRGNGAVIARSSQPEVGWLGWRSSEDERLLAAFVSACSLDRGLQPSNIKQAKLLIVDARSYTSAVTNRARGGGCECAQYYPGADIQFMSLPNIHHVRKSFHQLRQLAAEPPDQPNWHGMLERSLWLQNLSGLGRAASLAARAVLAGRPVLVHCSDGWDRTPQIVAAAQLLLDPFYRTIEGFRVLVEREWLDFGHKFADRCGHAFGPEEPNERSPIFLQWLDLVYQIMLQYPCHFEFSQAYLIKLVTHAHSCMFGTFLCNSPRERSEARVQENTAQVWKLLEGPAYRNHLYRPPAGEQALWAEYNVRSLSLWWSLYIGERSVESEEGDVEVSPPLSQPPPAPHPTIQPTATGGMTKTRSCDNLMSEAACDKPMAQRRCSDPSLAQDIIKLASLSLPSSECSSVGRCGAGTGAGAGAGAALTDSYLETLEPTRMQRESSDTTDLSASDNSDMPIHPTAILDQVDGLHVNHFENGDGVAASCQATRVMTSYSSSLERELAGDRERMSEEASRAEEHTNNAVTGSPDEATVFLDDNYAELVNAQEAAAESSRVRQISITWRSVSESSHHTDSSTGFDLAELPVRARTHNLATDLANHNISLPPHRSAATHTNGEVHHAAKMDAAAVKLLERELGNLTTATSSSISSDSEDEVDTDRERARMMAAKARTRPAVMSCASEHTLCPNSPSVRASEQARQRYCAVCCYCCRRASTDGVSVECSTDTLVDGEQCCCGPGGGGVERSASAPGAEEYTEVRSRCSCGGGAAVPARDPIDGLPTSHSPVQSRLHQIILNQKMVVEELSGQLRAARAALRRQFTSPPPPPHPSHRAPSANSVETSTHNQHCEGNGSLDAEADGSEEVEVGEEADAGAGAGRVVWLPDSAAPRCQYCRNHFWLARRRHHCRKCGGIFCGSCSEVGGGGARMRMCRVCSLHR